MQKRTSKAWPFRPAADPREDPLHPETLHDMDASMAEPFGLTIELVTMKAELSIQLDKTHR